MENQKNDKINEREQAELDRQIRLTTRYLAAKKSRESILDFAKFMMPHTDDPDDASRSMYQVARHHQVMAEALERVERGEIPRLIVTMPPRHGKTQLICKTFIPWYLGRDPYRSVIFATYNEDFAKDQGADIRNTIMHPAFKQVFPDFSLRKGGASKSRLQTNEGGLAIFAGRGGSITGRGGDMLVIDDLIKDAEEANSPTVREKCWEWFTQVAMTRLMTAGAGVIIVMTRWHEDDVVGRLTDPRNPNYSKEEAKKWKILNLPAIAEDGDPLGRKAGEALWPERFSLDFLSAQKTLNPRGFNALYQQRPTAEDGDYFKREWLRYYNVKDVDWRDLTIYAASDHAVGLDKAKHDQTVLLVVGVDKFDNIYIVDCWAGRKDTHYVTEEMINLMNTYKPLAWYAERGHITMSMGPHLRKRMQERNVFCTIDEVVPGKNKEQRAQSIRARMSMGKVYFPRGMPFLTDMIDELMKFPNGKHDDYVDPLAYVGLRLGYQYGASDDAEEENTGPKPGTFAWLKADAAYRNRINKHKGSGELL